VTPQAVGHGAPLDGKTRIKSIIGGSIGNLVEWYDWYAYASCSLYFAKVFFPSGSQTAQLLNTAAVFAVGFLMRPFGGWLMGCYADRHGRKTALMLSVLMMCGGSLLIAITPGYATIGVLAPTLLVFARLIQGLSVGGEYGASATYISEMATADRRGYYASFQYVTLIMGQLLALVVLVILQYFLSDDEIQRWGWRIPFFLGALCAVVALYLRRGIAETSSFVAASHDQRRGSMRELLAHPRALLTVVGLTMGGTIAYYTFATYMQKFLVNTAGWSKSDATFLSASTLVVYMLLQPLFGWISDRVGRRPLLITFGVCGAVMAVPFMTILSRGPSMMFAFVIIMLALTVISCYTSIAGIVKAEMFPAEVRALGVGLPYAIAVSVFGGSAEYIALAAKEAGHEAWFYWYVTVCISVSLLVYIGMRDTKAHSMIQEPTGEKLDDLPRIA
jgi:MFS transporter, MHS family, alpha-ketoglutarate permease